MFGILDAELIEDGEYAALGGMAVVRVKKLLGRLDSVEASRRRGSEVIETGEILFNKFVEQVEKIFSSLPRPKEWLSFYRHDLPLITDIDPEIKEWAIAPARALQPPDGATRINCLGAETIQFPPRVRGVSL